MVDTNRLGSAVFKGDLDGARADDRVVHLAGLVALGQVGIEIVFAIEYRDLGNLGMDTQAELHGHRYCGFVEYRQYTGQAQVDGAGLGVGLGTKGGRGTGEDFRAGRELNVDLKPNYGFPLHQRVSSAKAGRWRCQSVACWN